jgi:endonuclease YncB( thermonuclease family)
MLGPAHLLVLACAGLPAILGAGQALGDITGVASVVDGDTLELRGQPIRSMASTRRRAARPAWTRPARNGAAAKERLLCSRI